MAKSQSDYEEEARRNATKDLIREVLDEALPGILEKWVTERNSTRTGAPSNSGGQPPVEDKKKGGFLAGFFSDI